MTLPHREPKNRLGRWMGIGTVVGAGFGAVFHYANAASAGLGGGILVGSGLYALEIRRCRRLGTGL